MRVIIVMAMQTTLMDQLYVFLKPSIGFFPRVPPVANGHFNYLNLFILYCKSTVQADITKATTKRSKANIW